MEFRIRRNAKFIDWEQDTSAWSVAEDDTLIEDVLASMLDHGEPLYIFPAHTLKLATAGQATGEAHGEQERGNRGVVQPRREQGRP